MENKITGEINIAEMIEQYPVLVEILMDEYEFHCVNCILSGFDTLVEGAKIHGIEGEDFDEMLLRLNQVVEETMGDNS